VSSDHAALLPRNPEEPFPTPIREDLTVIEERKRNEKLEKRKKKELRKCLNRRGCEILKRS